MEFIHNREILEEILEYKKIFVRCLVARNEKVPHWPIVYDLEIDLKQALEILEIAEENEVHIPRTTMSTNWFDGIAVVLDFTQT